MLMVRVLCGFLAMMTSVPAGNANEIHLHAAGSLRGALGEISKIFETADGGRRIVAKYGPSGLLKNAIQNGEKAEVFASANMEHPAALAQGKRSGPVVLFARNELCALTRPGLSVSPAALLDLMLDPKIKLGTSTPKADPSGDYAFAVFARAEKVQNGARETLERKALQLTGGPNSPTPPAGVNVYGKLLAEGAADIFLTYCTNAKAAKDGFADLAVVPLPEALTVGADYGLTVINGASNEAYRFAMFLLSPQGQGVLAAHGFAAPTLPR